MTTARSTIDAYRERAERHAPRTVEELRDAARGMLRDGMSDHGVAAALGVDVNAVRRLVGECVGCGE